MWIGPLCHARLWACPTRAALVQTLLNHVQGGNYGAQRMYGAIGWGTMSLVAGVVIQHYGIYAGFACYTAVAVFAIVPLFLLPMDALHSKLAQSQLTARPTAAIAIAGRSHALQPWASCVSS